MLTFPLHIVLAFACTAAPPSGLEIAEPTAVGLLAERLDDIGPAMSAFVDDGRLPCVMTMIAADGNVVYWEAEGDRVLPDADGDGGDPLERDDIFRIYSMSKPITSCAVMMLVDDGAIALDDPVSKFIPEFADAQVVRGGELEDAATDVTVRHLLTHTGGLTYGFFGNTPTDIAYRTIFNTATSLEDFAARIGEQPLLSEPGERWHYSASSDILGRVVEVASGTPFEEFLQTRIFDPLEMDDTGFSVPAEDRDRFTGNYTSRAGALALADSPVDGRYTKAPAFPSGGGGLVSTASDYIRFSQMLLNDGELDGARVLSADSARAMRTNQLPAGMRTFFPGHGFGLGHAVLIDEDATPIADHNGEFNWAGAANTFYWIDPETRTVGLVWTQLAEFNRYPIRDVVKEIVLDAAIDEGGDETNAR